MTRNDNKNDDKTAARAARWGVWGGYLGIVLGSLGWLIGFAAVCLATGNGAVLASIAAPAAAVSLGAAFLVVICCDYAIKSRGPGGLFQLALYGSLSWAMGLLILLINHWIAPAIESSPAMAKTLREMNAVYRTDDLWPALLLSAGAILLGIFAFISVKDSANKK
jgi:hypothetical protein